MTASERIREAREFDLYTPLTVQARMSTVEGKGVGRWRLYFRAEGMREARSVSRHLTPSAQVRVLSGRAVVAGPMRVSEFLHQS